MQIRARLTLQFLMIVAGILLAVLFIIKYQFKQNLEQEYYKRLRWNAYMISDMITESMDSEEEISLEYPLDLTGPLAGYYPENVSIFNMDGELLYMHDSAMDSITGFPIYKTIESGEYQFAHGKFMALGLVYKNDAGNPFVIIVESFFDRVYMENLTQILSFVFLVSIAIVALGGWIFARQALAPVSRIMNQVDALLPTDMSQRLKPNNQYDELSRLVITFNKLLDRIQQVFLVQKQFVSNVSHELKNPLNIIISQAEIALDKDRSTEEYRHTLESILVDVKELNETGDRLMQLARISAEEANIRFVPLRVDEVIWEVKDQLLTNHPDYKINFEVTSLPEDEADLFVYANERLLKTAFANLIDNGCKYSPDKNVKVKLTFSEHNETSVEISDQGPGIPEEELSMIFNAFYRSASTSSTVRGSGIGLSLVESILKLHDIKLEIRSVVGKGTSFILRFPKTKMPA